MEPRLAFTLKLSVKMPSTGLRGILDEAVTPCDDWDARDTPDNHEWCLVVNKLQIHVTRRVTPVCFLSVGCDVNIHRRSFIDHAMDVCIMRTGVFIRDHARPKTSAANF